MSIGIIENVLWKWIYSFDILSNLAINGILGFILSGIVVLIAYFVYPTFEYLLPIGSILIIIGLVTILQIKIQRRF
jgi:hypothetical protein